MILLHRFSLLVPFDKLAVLIAGIADAQTLVDLAFDLLESVGGPVTVSRHVQQDALPHADKVLLQRFLVLKDTGQQNRPNVVLHVGRLADQQHILVVGQMQFAARLLVFVAHVVQFAAAATSCECYPKIIKYKSTKLKPSDSHLT